MQILLWPTLHKQNKNYYIAEALPDDLADELKQSILEKQKEILASVKEKINSAEKSKQSFNIIHQIRQKNLSDTFITYLCCTIHGVMKVN